MYHNFNLRMNEIPLSFELFLLVLERALLKAKTDLSTWQCLRKLQQWNNTNGEHKKESQNFMRNHGWEFSMFLFFVFLCSSWKATTNEKKGKCETISNITKKQKILFLNSELCLRRHAMKISIESMLWDLRHLKQARIQQQSKNRTGKRRLLSFFRNSIHS